VRAMDEDHSEPEDPYRYFITKRGCYRLPREAEGVPIEEVYPGARLSDALKGALVYQTSRGPIIACQEDRKPAPRAARPQHVATPARTKAPSPSPERKAPVAPAENPMRYFRRDAQNPAPRDEWHHVKITCFEGPVRGPVRHGIESAKVAAAEVRVLLMRHFPEGPAFAARAAAAASRREQTTHAAVSSEGLTPPGAAKLADRWADFRRAYVDELRETAAAGYVPATCDPFKNIDFTAVGRDVARAPRSRGSDRNDFEQ
jgi:hypothetical protein